jgi:hypothetical protein
VDKGYNGRKLPAITITSVVAHPTLGTKKVSRIDYLVAKFKYDVNEDYGRPNLNLGRDG